MFNIPTIDGHILTLFCNIPSILSHIFCVLVKYNQGIPAIIIINICYYCSYFARGLSYRKRLVDDNFQVLVNQV